MMKANKAREITENAIKQEIETRTERAQDFCDTVINQKIEDSARVQCSYVTIEEIDRKLYSYIVGILKDNGYTVTMLNATTLTVNW